MPRREIKRYKTSSLRPAINSAFSVYSRSRAPVAGPARVASARVTSAIISAGRDRLGFCPRDIEKPVGHGVIERQFLDHLTDLLVDMLVDPLRLVRSHAFQNLVEIAQTQVFGRRPHNAPNPIAARVAHDRRFLFQIKEARLAREPV